MALTLQRKLELAGDLAKVQPMLQRLHLMEKPKKRHRARNLILVSGAIFSGVAVVLVVCRRRGGNDGATPGSDDELQSGALAQDTPPTDFDQGVVPDLSARDPA